MKLLPLLLIPLLAFPVLAATNENEPGISVTWTFATHNMDGTALTNLAGAKVYYGTSSSNYTHVIDVPGGEPGETKTFRLTARVGKMETDVTEIKLSAEKLR